MAKSAFWRLAALPLVAAAAGPAAAIASFFPESRRDVKPRGSMFLEVVPSFSSMVFRCGEGCVLEACSTTLSSTTRSMQQQQQWQAQQLQSLCFYQNPEGTSSPGTTCFWRSFRPSVAWWEFLLRFGDFFVLHCHGVSGWRVRRFGGSEAVSLRAC